MINSPEHSDKADKIRNKVKCLDDLRNRELDLINELRDIQKQKKRRSKSIARISSSHNHGNLILSFVY